MVDSEFTHRRMSACAHRIAAAGTYGKATSLPSRSSSHAARLDHVALRGHSPTARQFETHHLEGDA
jgi:hypothetical protein